MDIQMRAGQSADITLHAKDSFGNPATIDGPIRLTSNAAEGVLEASVTGDLSFHVTSLGVTAVGAQVVVEGDADLSPTERLISAEFNFTILAGEAATFDADVVISD